MFQEFLKNLTKSNASAIILNNIKFLWLFGSENMLIYCAHKYGGIEENKNIAEQKIKELQMNDLKNCYISPIHCFGYMYDAIDYDAGMEMCYDLLTACDEVLVLSDLSEGVKREIRLAQKLHIPIKFVEQKE